MIGNGEYSIRGSTIHPKDEIAARELVLMLSNCTGETWRSLIAPELDPELPWIFEADHLRGLFLRQGGGSIDKQEVWALVPKSWRVIASEKGDYEQIGFLSCFDRTIYHAMGHVIFEAIQGDPITYNVEKSIPQSTHSNGAEQDYGTYPKKVLHRSIEEGLNFSTAEEMFGLKKT